MVGAGVDFAFAARADDVARTILLIAKKQTAARGKFKLRFSWQMFARPFRVSLRVGIRGLHHRIIALAFDVALRPERVPPVRAFDVAPPLIVIVERNFAVGRREDYCAGYEI